jgi:Ran GTPase-activating protein (RanGAP) involved in mRNA processing and transport
MLSNKYKLSKLNLNNNPINDEGLIKICDGITKIETLRIMMVAGCGLSKNSILHLSQALKNKRFLTKLVLDNNNIGSEGAKLLSKGLK